MNLMPVLYTPKSAYTSHTSVWVPVLVAAARAGAIFMLEWLSLRFIENAPLAVCIATGVFAIAVLAILQTKDWLDFKGRWYFRGSLLAAVVIWAALVGYGYWAYPPTDHVMPRFPTADEIGAAIARNLRPATNQPAPAAAAVTADKRKNPLDDDAAKWRLVKGLHDVLKTGLPKRKILIVRYQVAWSEHLADDLKVVLTAMDWEFSESFALSQLSPGLAVWGVNTGDSKTETWRTAASLAQSLRNSGMWHERMWAVPANNLSPNTSDGLALLTCGCVQVSIGNDPDQ